MRDGFINRDETIRRLNDKLVKAAGQEAAAPLSEAAEDVYALKSALAELDKRLAHETSRRKRLEQRLEAASTALSHAERARQRAERELASIEPQLGALLQITESAPSDGLDLHGLTVLYVGGRANQAPQLKGLVESTNGRFLHHDGGLEHSAALLPGLVSRADIAAFPVDCVSHDAVTAIKRACRQLGKRYIPLRTSSLTCLLSGLSALQDIEATMPLNSRA